MKIVIAGDGKVGYTLTQQLSLEGHDVVVIDNNAFVLRESQDSLDVAIVHGNAASMELQQEAGVQSSDLLIAATSSDEVNLLCCLVARKLGCKHTIARVRNPEYDQQIGLLKEELGLSMSVNPEKACAREIYRLLQFPSFLKRDSFAKGRVELVELKLKPGNALIGHRLMDIHSLGLGKVNMLICTVERGDQVAIPSGPFQLQEGDKITVAADATELARLLRALNVRKTDIQSALIVGGGRIAVYLARQLLRSRVQVTIIENQMERCEALTTLLPDAMVIHGDGTDQQLLLAEGIKDTDAVITLTGMDEENLIVSMFANYVGVPKTITKINRTEYAAVFADKGIDTTVSPKTLTTDEIVSYVRAINNTTSGSVVTLYRLVEGKAEAVEFSVKGDAPFLNIPLQNLQLKPHILLASIIRERKVIIPKGQDSMQRGDTVVVVTTSDRHIYDLQDIFQQE